MSLFAIIGILLTAYDVLAVLAQGACGTGADVATFNFTLRWKDLAPDGFQRRVITVNDQYPGPPLRVKQGADVKVTVLNELDQPSSIHWHGIDQRGTPEMDGVAGVSQEPIKPGSSFVYCFRTAGQPPGSYMYHAHVGSQYPEGLYGPIIIDPVDESLRLYELRVQGDFYALVNDWYHPSYETLVQNALRNNIVPACANSLLINGKGRVQCGAPLNCSMGNDMGMPPMDHSGPASVTATTPTSASSGTTEMSGMPGMSGMHKRQMTPSPTPTGGPGMPGMPMSGMQLDKSNLENCTESASALEVFPVRLGSTYRFRFGNIGAFTNLNVAIDKHKMTIIEADGILLKDTQIVDVLTIAIGQRYSVLIKADQPMDNYWVRTWRTDEMQKLEGRAVLRYEGVPNAYPQESSIAQSVNTSTIFLQTQNLKPLIDAKPPPKANRTIELNVRAFADNNWTLQGDIPGFFPDPFATPLLVKPIKNPNIISLGFGDIVDLIIKIDQRTVDTMAHPLHLHGQSFWVLGAGNGSFNENNNLNIEDPVRRDTELIPANGWLVLRFLAQNPGTWFFHCHVDFHMMAGLNILFDVGRDSSGMDGGHASNGGAIRSFPQTLLMGMAITFVAFGVSF